MKIKPTKVGKEIEKNLNSVNLEPWYHIYENYIQNNSKEKLNQTEQEEDSDD